jgi:putative heme iron utilization protein
LIEKAVEAIRHWQQRLAAARESHIKRTRKKLRKMGIYLKDLIRCKWP